MDVAAVALGGLGMVITSSGNCSLSASSSSLLLLLNDIFGI